ncbi:MAG: dolichol-phosphate mannosyltransferase [Anaerolineaceae bacterium]|nr:dolichol-phosphate mannosyltransferase [Anaerolineaceae bacterium]|tara:strand:- start:27156 stop:27899 length:744 start_codon:yes stop_codon:yes gene_type:complete
MFVCTVLPTYNEEENIELLVERLLKNHQGSNMVLIVDDDSCDATSEKVRNLSMRYNKINKTKVAMVQRRNDRGLTTAIQYGIDVAIRRYSANIVTWMDCDLSMPPEDVPELLRPILEGSADIVIGSRWISGGSDIAHGFMAQTLSKTINYWAQLFLGNDISDYTSGFVAANTKVLKTLRLQGDYGEYCIDFLCRSKRNGYKIVEIPYVCVPRTQGQSKTGLNLYDYLIRGRKYIGTVWRLFISNQSV